MEIKLIMQLSKQFQPYLTLYMHIVCYIEIFIHMNHVLYEFT